MIETMRRGAERASGTLFRGGAAGLVVAVAADWAAHAVGANALEPVLHMAVFAFMAATAFGLVLRGVTT